MGYSEVPCHLCGVSFNIGRIRRHDEPRITAWNAVYSDLAGYYVTAAEMDGNRCFSQSPDTGCSLVFRGGPGGSNLPSQTEEEEEEEDDDPEDQTYVYQSDEEEEEEEEEEIYEFESDDEMIDREEQDVVGTDKDDDMTDAEEGIKKKLCSGHSYLDELAINSISTAETFLPLSNAKNDDWQSSHDLEHVAGPGCVEGHGYNGHSISYEEMRSCVVVQCLVRKNRGWEPESDDQEFELSSDFFLSGISNRMPSRDDDFPTVVPARHGLEKPQAEVFVFDVDFETMPFHPTCFEMFTRMSRQKLGFIDINGLMAWRKIEKSYNDFYDFPRSDTNVRRCSKQWWNHHNGTEYLAASPIFIPSLATILRSAISEDPTFSVQNGAFETSDSDELYTQKGGLASDPFLQLPKELIYLIVNFLGSIDIANLRLASRAFRQLPIYLWERLLKEEKPWVWEVWSNDKPYPWLYKTVEDTKSAEVEKGLHMAELAIYRTVIRKEMPEMLDDWIKAEPECIPTTTLDALQLNSMLVYLPKHQTNWYEVYRGLTLHGKELNGLKNRARIWEDLEEIFRRVEKYRKEGKIQA